MDSQITEKNFGFAGRLNRKDALLSIEEYAAKKGILVETVEQSIKEGNLQIRRHRGKTFIVERPLRDTSQKTEPITIPALQQIPNIPEPYEKMKKQDIPAGSISELAWKMFRNSHKSPVVPVS